MSVSTIYVLVKDQAVVAVAEATDATMATAQLSWWTGEIYACRIGDSAAAEVRAKVSEPAGSVTRGVRPATALSLLKMYSQSMVKVADSTGA